jgi:hypothetical protein
LVNFFGTAVIVLSTENFCLFVVFLEKMCGGQHIFVWLLLFSIVCHNCSFAEYFNDFIANVANGKYDQDYVQKEWTQWETNKNLMIYCQVPTKSGDSPALNAPKYPTKTSIIGKNIQNRRCTFYFPKAGKKTLGEIFQLLWGFTKQGFFDVSSGPSKRHTVQIEMQTLLFNFKIQWCSKQLCVFFDNAGKAFLDYDKAATNLDESINNAAKQMIQNKVNFCFHFGTHVHTLFWHENAIPKELEQTHEQN